MQFSFFLNCFKICLIFAFLFIMSSSVLVTLIKFKRPFIFLNHFLITVHHLFKTSVLVCNSCIYLIYYLRYHWSQNFFHHIFHNLFLIFYQSVSHKYLYHRTSKLSVFRNYPHLFLIGIQSMQGWTAFTRHVVTRKRNTKRLKLTINLFRKNLQLKDVC